MSYLQKYKVSIILFTINFIVKGLFLASNSLGADEPFSVYHAQMNIQSIISLLSYGNNPPLYEIILHYWIKYWGISEISVRFPSLIFSSLTVIYIYKIGFKYFNYRIALYSSILFIFSNYHILFAHQARVYSFLGLLSVISMYYFMGILNNCREESLEKSTIRREFISLIIINTLIIYSHYFGFFILIIQFLLTISHKKMVSKYWRSIVLLLAIVALLYTPNIYVLLNRFFESSTHGTWVKPPDGIDSLYNMLRSLSNAPVVTVIILLILLASLVKSIIRKQVISIYTRVIVFWFFFIFIFMFIISYSIPMFSERYLMPASVAFIIIIAISLDYLVEKKNYRYVLPCLVIMIYAFTIEPNISNKRNVRETVAKIKDIQSTETLVIICPANFIVNFAYYYDPDVFKEYGNTSNYSNIHQTMRKENIYGINSINDVDLKKWEHIVFLDAAANFSRPNNGILEYLNINYELSKSYYYHEIFNISEYKINSTGDRVGDDKPSESSAMHIDNVRVYQKRNERYDA